MNFRLGTADCEPANEKLEAQLTEDRKVRRVQVQSGEQPTTNCKCETQNVNVLLGHRGEHCQSASVEARGGDTVEDVAKKLPPASMPPGATCKICGRSSKHKKYCHNYSAGHPNTFRRRTECK